MLKRTSLSTLVLGICLCASTSAWATSPLYADYKSTVEGAPPCLAIEAQPHNINSSENARFKAIPATNRCLNQSIEIQEVADNALLQTYDAQSNERWIDITLDDLPVSTPRELTWKLKEEDDMSGIALVEEGTMTLTIECVSNCGQGEDQGNVGCIPSGSRGSTDASLGMLMLIMGGVGIRRRKH